MWQGVVLGTGSEGKPRRVSVLGWCRKTNTVDPRAEKTVGSSGLVRQTCFKGLDTWQDFDGRRTEGPGRRGGSSRRQSVRKENVRFILVERNGWRLLSRRF